MMFWTAPVFAAALPFATALPTYAIPKSFAKALAQADCPLPEGFEIHDFQTWTPAEGNNASATLQFGYVDKSTGLETACQYNSTSKNVGSQDSAARYACDNPLAQFIWQNDILTVIETACPGASGSTTFEASGSAKPETKCSETSCDFEFGDGSQCFAVSSDIQANFTSLQPSPP